MTNIGQGMKKTLLFAVCAVIGCLLAAVFGEMLLALTLPMPTTHQGQVDVLFVVDVTGNMKEEIIRRKTRKKILFIT